MFCGVPPWTSTTQATTFPRCAMAPPDDRCVRRELTSKRRRDASAVPVQQAPVPTQSAPRARGVETAKQTGKQPAYVLKRQEKSALAEQARELEEQLDRLRKRAGLPTRDDKHAIDQVKEKNATLDEALRANALYLGHLDSMITNELLSPPVNTLSTFIHLPQDMAQRRAILCGMQEVKLRRGIEVATEWLHHLDHTVPYLDERGFTIASGEYHYYRSEFDQYPNFKTARQFYNTFVQFLYNMEISVTEGLSQLTLREDSDDLVDPTIWNPRFVTVTDGIGVPEELNFVFFAQFYPHSPYTNSPMGVIVADTVNIDELYPYVPEERTCKEVQGVHMVFEVPKPGTNETIVVFKQIRFGVQLPSMFKVAPGVLKKLCDNFGDWPNYIVKYLHEYVVPEGA